MSYFDPDFSSALIGFWRSGRPEVLKLKKPRLIFVDEHSTMRTMKQEDQAHLADTLPRLTDSFVCDDEQGVRKFLNSSDLKPEDFEYYAVLDQDSQKMRIYGEARISNTEI